VEAPDSIVKAVLHTFGGVPNDPKGNARRRFWLFRIKADRKIFRRIK